MRLRVRLVLFIGMASILPLGVLGLGATRVSSRLVLDEVALLQGSAARALSDFVDTWLGLQFRLLSLQARSFPVEDLTDRDRAAWVRLVYRQTPEAHVVSLTTADGVDVTPSVYLTPDQAGSLPGRDGVDQRRFRRFREALPLDAARAAIASLPAGADLPPIAGRPYLPDGRRAPVLPVAVVLPGRSQVLGVELGLDPVADRIAAETGNSRDVTLLGADGRPVVAAGGGGLVDPDIFRAFVGGAVAEDVRYTTAGGRAVLAACAPVARTDWLVAIAEPVEVTTAPITQIRDRTAYIAAVAAFLSLALGIVFARQLSGPVVELKNAALAVAEGELGRRVVPHGGDELSELARAFNFMSTRLQRNAEEIHAKNEEIQAFNAELQQRVDDRTRELREAQARLVHSARMAAVGEMGSGLAHELNNPVAGILGLAQVLLVRESAAPAAGMLRAIEEQALRCRDILSRLIGLSRERGPAMDPAERVVVDLHEVLRDVLALVSGPMRTRGIEVDHRVEAPVPARVERAEIGRAFAQLLTSLKSVPVRGARLRIAARAEPECVAVDFHLAGPELRVGGDDWKASGMGFWAASHAFAEHGGSLVLPELAPGPLTEATWKVVLPAA